jgi:hypothetical protein
VPLPAWPSRSGTTARKSIVCDGNWNVYCGVAAKNIRAGNQVPPLNLPLVRGRLERPHKRDAPNSSTSASRHLPLTRGEGSVGIVCLRRMVSTQLS